MSLRVIGDVHGKLSEYIHIALGSNYSLQIGDMGFTYAQIHEVDQKYHRVLAGNHDNYSIDNDGNYFIQPRHFLGDYGIYGVPVCEDVFFVRGGLSIDRLTRLEGVDWWKDEELTAAKGEEAINLYSQIKPNLVITHEAPNSVICQVTDRSDWSIMKSYGCHLPSYTSVLLQTLFEIHQPDRWIFGHYHRDSVFTVGNTEFTCLDELSYVDIT